MSRLCPRGILLAGTEGVELSGTPTSKKKKKCIKIKGTEGVFHFFSFKKKYYLFCMSYTITSSLF